MNFVHPSSYCLDHHKQNATTLRPTPAYSDSRVTPTSIHPPQPPATATALNDRTVLCRHRRVVCCYVGGAMGTSSPLCASHHPSFRVRAGARLALLLYGTSNAEHRLTLSTHSHLRPTVRSRSRSFVVSVAFYTSSRNTTRPTGF